MRLNGGRAVTAGRTGPGERGRRRILIAVLAVPVICVLATMAVYAILSRAGALPWQIGLVTVAVGLATAVGGFYLVVRYGRSFGHRRNAGFRDAAAQWARAQHWRVREGNLGATWPYPEHLRSPNFQAQECDQIIQGQVRGRRVRIESWDGHHQPTGAAWVFRQRQQLVRISASADLPLFMLVTNHPRRSMSGVPWSLVRTPLLPTGPGMGTIDPEGVGRWLRPPLLITHRESARVTGANVILTPGEVVLVFPSDAEPQVLTHRVDLAVAITHTVEAAAQGASG